MKMKTTRLALAALAGAMALGLAGCGGSAGTAAGTEKPRGVPVRTAVVERRDLDDTLVLTGTLRPRAQVQVVSEVSARLLRIVHDEGSRVAKGDVLAVLDDTDYRLSHDRARAALEVADANRSQAGVEKDRADSLLKTGGITDKDRLAAEVALQVAEASRGQARAEESIAAVHQARCQITAPFDGRVAKRVADPGSMLAVGTPVFTLVDDAVLEFRAPVPSGDWARAKVGSEVGVTVDALPGFEAKGRVARIAPLVEERTRAFEVVVEVPGNKDLVGGLFARAAVRAGHVAQALVVPPAALVRDGGTPGEAQTFVVVAGKAERRTVSLGVESPDAIQVTKGLEAGDVVVLDPPVSLGSGALVEPQTARRN
jgi:membrane fusion protein (multidrug efflux system)